MKYKTFVINLERSPERLRFMKEQFVQLAMAFEIQKAIDGSTYDFKDEFDEALSRKHNGGRLMTQGEIGCALSHKKTLERVLAEDLDYALIMEDDVELSPQFKKILEQELARRERGETTWEYLSFNYPSVGWKSIALWSFLFFYMMKDNRKNPMYWLKLPVYMIKFLAVVVFSLAEGAREWIYRKLYAHGKPARFYRPLYLAGCYLVTPEGAQKLLKVNQKLTYAADRVQNVARIQEGLRFYAFVPLVARQKRETFESILNNRHFNKKIISY